jgi:cytoskeletal protein CcmA (bactofilin family)
MFKKNQREGWGGDSSPAEGDVSQDELRDTIIAQGVKVEGDFKSKGNIIIEGMVSGSVKTENDLHVGEKAKISANLTVQNAHIAGEVQGNIKAKEKLELATTSRVYGDIEAKTLIINAGAIFNGKCAMTDESAPANIRADKKLKKEEDAREKIEE